MRSRQHRPHRTPGSVCPEHGDGIRANPGGFLEEEVASVESGARGRVSPTPGEASSVLPPTGHQAAGHRGPSAHRDPESSPPAPAALRPSPRGPGRAEFHRSDPRGVLSSSQGKGPARVLCVTRERRHRPGEARQPGNTERREVAERVPLEPEGAGTPPRGSQRSCCGASSAATRARPGPSRGRCSSPRGPGASARWPAHPRGRDAPQLSPEVHEKEHRSQTVAEPREGKGRNAHLNGGQ